MLFLIGNCWSLLSRLKSLNNWSVSWKWYPILDPNSLIYIPRLLVSQSKLLENHNPAQWLLHVNLYSIYISPGGNMYFCMWHTVYLFLEYSCSSSISSVLQNGSYLDHQSSVLFAFKICFDQIFVVGIFLGRFQQKMQLWPGCVFKGYATHFLMWPPLWYNSKLAKSIPLFLNPYPFIQKSPFMTITMYFHHDIT